MTFGQWVITALPAALAVAGFCSLYDETDNTNAAWTWLVVFMGITLAVGLSW